MSKEHIATQLRSFYAQTKRQISMGNIEFVLENIFGIENLKAFVAEQFEEVYQDFFVDKKVDTEKRKLLSYDDPYDFLNTILHIDTNDFIIFFTHEELIEYVMSLLTVLNRALNQWSQHRKAGFRKGTRIFLEMDKGGIHLFLKPEIKT